MTLINPEVAAGLKEEFQNLVSPVRLLVFSPASADPETDEVKGLALELAALDSRIRTESYDFVLDQDKVAALGIARVPAIAVMGESKDYGLRLYGLPRGYEFGALVDAILDVSSGESGLADETKTALRALDKAVHIQVFSTPTCPYCPRALRLAYRFAIESDRVTADGVEITGYPDLVGEYNVSSVPKTVVSPRLGTGLSDKFSAGRRFGTGLSDRPSGEFSDKPSATAPGSSELFSAPFGRRFEFIGAGPEAMLLKYVQEAAGVSGL